MTLRDIFFSAQPLLLSRRSDRTPGDSPAMLMPYRRGEFAHSCGCVTHDLGADSVVEYLARHSGQTQSPNLDLISAIASGASFTSAHQQPDWGTGQQLNVLPQDSQVIDRVSLFPSIGAVLSAVDISRKTLPDCPSVLRY